MADEQEILLNSLVTRFSVDPESVRQSVEAIRSGKDEEARAIEEAERKISSSLSSHKDRGLQKHAEYLLELEGKTRDYYSRQIAIHSHNAEETRRLEENLFSDLAKIRQQAEDIAQQQATAGGVDGAKADALGFGAARNNLMALHSEAMPLLRSIGMQGLAVGASWGAAFSFIGAQSNEAVARLREMRTIGRSQAFAAGMEGTGFGQAFAGGLRTIKHMTEGTRSEEQIGRLAAQFTPIMEEGGVSGGARLAELTTQAIGMGGAYSVSEDLVAKTMVMFRRLEDIPVQEVGSRFHQLAESARDAGFTVGSYAQLVGELSENTKRYSVGVDANQAMISLFARELQTGIVSIQDLTRLQVAGAGAPMGNRAFFVEQAFERGLMPEELSKHFKGMTSPVARAFLAKRIQQGEEGTEAQTQLRSVMAGLARTIGGEMAAGVGGSAEDAEQLATMFSHQIAEKYGFDLGSTVKAGESLLDAAQGQKEASEGLLKAAATFDTMGEAIAAGFAHLTGQTGIQQRIWLDVQRSFEGLVTGFGGLTEDEKNQRAGEIATMMSSANIFGGELPEAEKRRLFGHFANMARENPEVFSRAASAVSPDLFRLGPGEAAYHRDVASKTGFGENYDVVAYLLKLAERELKIIVENPSQLILETGREAENQGTLPVGMAE